MSWDYEYNASANAGDGQLNITHTGGATLSPDKSNQVTVSVCDNSNAKDWIAEDAGNNISAGDTFVLNGGPSANDVDPGCHAGGTIQSGTEVRIVWESPSGSKTQVIGTFTVPS